MKLIIALMISLPILIFNVLYDSLESAGSIFTVAISIWGLHNAFFSLPMHSTTRLHCHFTFTLQSHYDLNLQQTVFFFNNKHYPYYFVSVSWLHYSVLIVPVPSVSDYFLHLISRHTQCHCHLISPTLQFLCLLHTIMTNTSPPELFLPHMYASHITALSVHYHLYFLYIFHYVTTFVY